MFSGRPVSTIALSPPNSFMDLLTSSKKWKEPEVYLARNLSALIVNSRYVDSSSPFISFLPIKKNYKATLFGVGNAMPV